MPCGSVLGGAAQNGSCPERESCRAVVLLGDDAGNGSVAQADCGNDSFRGNVSRISFMTLYDSVIWRKREGDALLNKSTCVSVW